ncbi:phosphotransferase family protein [Nonomuraea sp. NPDC050556]|uniref:phosphotransferase family protein n=1 Tax=Nonomuraea sp. NPDC050556 TaxID=3364369 RepID=UPI00378A0C57
MMGIPGLELAALQRYFGEHVPECAGPLEAELIHGGRSNLTYLVTDGQARWIVRRPPLGPLTPSAHDMGREFRVMSALQDTAVAVPRTVAMCEDAEVIGAPFSVVAYVTGRVLRTQEELDDLTPAQLDACADGLVNQLAALHAVPYQEIGLADFGRPEGYLARQVKRWRGQWDLVATRDLPDLHRLHHLLESTTPAESAASIVHGDFRVDNTILAPDDLGRVLAVVDWELSALGDPLADLGTFLAYRDPVVDALLGEPTATSSTRFPDRTALAERYAARSGRDLSELPFYLALAYFKIAVIAEGIHARHLQGATVGRGFDAIGKSVPTLVQNGLEQL